MVAVDDPPVGGVIFVEGKGLDAGGAAGHDEREDAEYYAEDADVAFEFLGVEG